MLATIHNYLVKLIKFIVCVLFVVMIVVGFGQVIARYFFGLAYAWASELTQFSMVWMCFLGAAILALEEGHTNVDYFLNMLPKWVRQPIYVFSELLLVVLIGALIYYFVPTWFVDLRTITPGLEIPIGWVTGGAVLGLALTAIYTLVRLARILSSRG